MISRAFAESQLARMSLLDGFNFLPAEGLRELRDAMEQGFEPDNPAKPGESLALARAVTSILNDPVQPESWQAVLAALRRLGATSKPKRQLGCEACDHTGWVIVEVNGIEGARKCRCRSRDAA